MSSNIKLSYDNKDFVNAKFIKNVDTCEIQSDIIYDKYIVNENNIE